MQAYAFAGIAAFAVVLAVCGDKGNEEVFNFNGLGKRSPLMAAVLTCSLLSMAGIPIFSGFFAKFFLFNQVMSTNHIAIVIIAILNSIVSVGYYFRLILAMYTKEDLSENQPSVPVMYTIVAVAAIVLNIAMGLHPDFVLGLLYK